MKQRSLYAQFTLRGLPAFVLALALAGVLALAPQVAWAQDFDDIADHIDEIRTYTPTYEESFREDDGTWDIDPDLETSHVAIMSSNYRITVVDEQTYYWGTSAQTAEDLLLEVDAYRLDGPLDNEFGLVLRHEDVTDFYTFLVSSDGYYKMQKQVDDAWEDIVPWTATELVDQTEGAVNRVGAYASGTTLALLINGEIVDAVEDDSLAFGEIGLAAGSYGEGGVAVAFDDLVMWDLNALEGGQVLPVVTPEPADEPTPESSVKPTGEPTEEPLSPTPEPVDIDVSGQLDFIRAGEVTFSDDFRRDTGAWGLPEGDAANAEIASRVLTIDVHDTDWMAWANLLDTDAADFLVEVDAMQTAGTLLAEFGIIFNYRDADNFNFFAVDADGGWSYWVLEDGSWTDAQDWTLSDAFDLGLDTMNRLGVLVDQGLITLLINDEVVGQFEGEAGLGGGIALTVGTFDEGEVSGVFDNFDLWVQAEGDEVVEAVESGEPVATPEDEPVATPEVADVPAGEEMSADVADITAVDPTYTTDFRRDDGAWSPAEDDDVEHFNQARTLRILVDREQWVSWSLQQDLTVSDFYAEVDAERIVGPEVGEYGFVFRMVDDANFYAYYISGNGYWSIYSQVDGEWHTLVDWTDDEALDFSEGAVNRLGVLADGALLTFFINGEQVGQIEDDTFSEGSIGVTAGTFDEPGLEIAFDNFSYWSLSE